MFIKNYKRGAIASGSKRKIKENTKSNCDKYILSDDQMFKKVDFMGSKKFNSNLLNENIAKKKNGTIWIGNVSHGRAHGTLSAQLINTKWGTKSLIIIDFLGIQKNSVV